MKNFAILNRRDVFRLAGVAAGAVAGREAEAKPLGLPVGIQPYTVRNELKADFAGTVRKLKAMGYEAIETGDPFYDQKPAELRQFLKSVGMITPNGFYPYPADDAAWAKSLEHAGVLGLKYMITTIPNEWRKSLDGWKRAAARFNELGALSKKAGITLAYHNHNFEYKVYDGVVAYDEFLHSTDPQLVKMEMDCFWTTIAGKDPVAYLNANPGRFPLLHIKGLKKGVPTTLDSPKENPFTEVGSGVIDYKPIFQAAKKSGLKYYFVEQDRWDGTPLESARLSCEYLHKLKV